MVNGQILVRIDTNQGIAGYGEMYNGGVAPYALPQQLLLGAGQYEIIGRHQKWARPGRRCGGDAAKQ